MLRREFLTVLSAAAPVASLLNEAAKHWPFEEVDWFIPKPCHDGIWWYAFDYRYCDLCDAKALEDHFDGKDARKFYRTTDGSNLIVCEHCVPEFLKG